jgi:hypothetical protein
MKKIILISLIALIAVGVYAQPRRMSSYPSVTTVPDTFYFPVFNPAVANYKIRMDSLFNGIATTEDLYKAKWNHTWLYFADSARAISVTEDVWAQVTNASDSLFRVRDLYGNITISGDTIILEPTDWDHYNVNAKLAISPNANNNRLQVRLATINQGGDISELTKAYVPATAGNDTTSVSLYGYWMPKHGNKLIMQIMNTVNSGNPTVIGGHIVAQWYHYEDYVAP